MLTTSGAVKRKYEEETATTPPQCKFGKDCYRLNVEHFNNYIHDDGSIHKSAAECHELFQKVVLPSSMTQSCPGAADSNPYSVYFNTVEGIQSCFNENCLSIKDLLSDRYGNLIKSVQFNYCIDIPWLMSQYPSYNKTKPLLIVHGFKGEDKISLHESSTDFGNVRLCQANLDIPYGTHHTKMMLHLYEEGIRVIITTANLVENDWTKKTQSIWVSPMFPKLDPKSDHQNLGDSITNFRKDIIDYLSSYKKRQLDEWVGIVRQHDFSEAKVYLIASVPGRFSTDTDPKFGHLKLGKILKWECKDTDQSWPIICQASSIGSLGDKPDIWLKKEFLSSLSGGKRGNSKEELMIVYPTVENIRNSLEGYMGGASFPYFRKTAAKQTYLRSFMRQWKFDLRGRSRAMPHLKSYFRLSSDHKEIAWYLLTSANVSKAAWGSLEKNQSQLFIRSYELGVLHLPKHYNASANSNVFKDFPQSVDFPPIPYTDDDNPWIVDMPYTDIPDCKGRIWDPR